MTTARVLRGGFGSLTLYDSTGGIVEHAHAEPNILFKRGGADTVVHAGTRTLPLDDGTLVLLDPWVPHARAQSPAGPTAIGALLLDEAWVRQVLGLPEAWPLLRVFAAASAPRAGAVGRALQQVESAIDHSASPALLEAAVAALLRTLTVSSHDETGPAGARRPSQPMDPRTLRANEMDPRIARAVTLLHADPLAGVDLDRVARQVGLSRSRFFELFKRCNGVTPQLYVDWLRVRTAVAMLATTSRPIADISAALGYRAPSHFTRFFVRHAGMPPSAYRGWRGPST